MGVNAPAHPVPQLQGPFEESMLESVNDVVEQETYLDAAERRATLLEKPHYERVCAGRWKQKPGEKYHPLWKIAAQTSFGMHLLAEGMAKSEDEVMKILQSHVDDVDGFLERTTEDFDLALGDVQERLRYLKLPLDHIDVFDRMLEDRTFRASIVDGNEKIEHIVERTSKSIRDALKDVQKGLDATRALGRYLEDLEPQWDRTTAEHEAVFVAMLGNVEGWGRAFLDLHLQGNRLKVILVELSETVSEMMRRAGVISRKSVVSPLTEPPLLFANPIQRRTQIVAPVMASMTNGNSKHYSSRKSRIETTGAEHKPSRSSTQKALPSAPGSHRSSRPAERRHPQEAQKTSDSTPTAGARPKSKNDSQAFSGLIPAGMTDQEDFYARPFSPANSSRVTSPSSTNAPTLGSSRENLVKKKTLTKRTQPIELPADVPQSALLHAPLSKANRESMNLGPKSPGQSDHRMSSKLSNKVLASLLKSPLSNRLSRTPQSVNSGKTNESYTTAFDNPSGHTAEYFSAADVRRAISVDNEAEVPNASSGVVKTVQGLGIESPPLAQRSVAVSPGRSPKPHDAAFTSHPPERRMVGSPLASHPPDIEMVMSPQAKQEPFQNQSAASSDQKASTSAHSRFPSLTASSLGEPGPEIDNSEPFDLAMLVEGNEPAKKTTSSSPSSEHRSGTISPDVMRSNIKDFVDMGVLQDTSASTPVAEIPRPLVAELEGAVIVPNAAAPVPQDQNSFGPAELEAPIQHLCKLPPRSSAIAQARPDEGGMTSATIASQSDFFKMPPPIVGAEADGSAPPELSSKAKGKQSHLSMPLSGHQKPSSTVTENRLTLPSTMLARSIPRKPAKPATSRLTRLQSADILEKLSFTPPGSPIHTRSSSEMSANSAQRLSARISISTHAPHPLAPSQEAPPPPGPGGRPMVSPDYAAAGLFEGERKSKHGSRGSTGNQASWKKFFGAAHHSPLGGTPTSGSSSTSRSYFDAKAGVSQLEGVEERAQGMLDAAGKDVLWFKGMSNDGVWVATTTTT